MVPAALLLLLGFIQIAGHATLDFIVTRESLVKLSTNLILFFLASQVFDQSDRTMRLYGWAIVWYTFALALVSICQFYTSPGQIFWSVPSPGWTFGPYVNHNHYAGLMEMLIPLSVTCALPARSHRVSPFLLAFLISVPIASLLLSGSRGGLIAFVGELILAGIIVLRRGTRRARQAAGVVGGMVVALAVLLFLWMAPQQITQRLASMGKSPYPAEIELGNRLAASRDALRIFQDHLYLGAGLGSFETVFPQYQTFASDFRWDHAHNDYAEALAETGLAGGVILLGGLVLFFSLAFRNLRRRLRFPAAWVQLGAALGCCGVLIHSCADFSLHLPANAAWFAVCIAIATGREVPGGALS
jgi:O-antigen ligase